MACQQNYGVDFAEFAQANLANRNRGDGCDECPDCCPHCESWTIDCPECCKCLPRTLCFAFTPNEPYAESVLWAMDYIDNGSYGTISVSCGGIDEYDGHVSTVEAVLETEYGECQWRFTVDGVLHHIASVYEAGCMLNNLEFEDVAIGNCLGILQVTTQGRLVMPVEREEYTNCWSNWCDIPGGSCNCLCAGICVTLSGGEGSVVVPSPNGEGPPWSWSETLRTVEFQDVEGDPEEFPFTFTIDRNEYNECMAYLDIAEQLLEEPLTGMCSELSVSFEVYLHEGDYEPVTITVECAKCGECQGPDICCNRTLPRTLHLAYETANELDADSDSPSGGVSYSTELQYQDDFRYWLGWKESGAGESCIETEAVAGFRYHLRFEFQCDLAADETIVIRVAAAPAYNPITDETFPMPDPFDADLWDFGTDGPCGECGVEADEGFTPAGSRPNEPSTESLSLCDPFLWFVNVPDNLRSDEFGEGERLECTCAGVDWGAGAGKRYIVYFWNFTVTE
jgi:hypothetical protein